MDPGFELLTIRSHRILVGDVAQGRNKGTDVIFGRVIPVCYRDLFAEACYPRVIGICTRNLRGPLRQQIICVARFLKADVVREVSCMEFSHYNLGADNIWRVEKLRSFSVDLHSELRADSPHAPKRMQVPCDTLILGRRIIKRPSPRGRPAKCHGAKLVPQGLVLDTIWDNGEEVLHSGILN